MKRRRQGQQSISIWAVAQQIRAHLGTLPSQKKTMGTHIRREVFLKKPIRREVL
jgi:hypothetical protein